MNENILYPRETIEPQCGGVSGFLTSGYIPPTLPTQFCSLIAKAGSIVNRDCEPLSEPCEKHHPHSTVNILSELADLWKISIFRI